MLKMRLNSFTIKTFKALTLWTLFGLSQSAATEAEEQLQNQIQPTNSSKLVFAHFMLAIRSTGLTVNYSQSDWSSQCALAASHDIDAFALNVGLPDEWQTKQVESAYEAVKTIKTSSGKEFKLFLSLDMSVIQTAEDVAKWVTNFARLPSQFFSTFSGEANNLGGESLSSGWQAALKAPLAAGNPPLDALFIPAWSSLDPVSAVSNNPVVDGIMTWNSWPTGSESTNTLNDLQFQKNAKDSENKLYMAGVSPCFFTHYQDKNWIYRSDDNLYISRRKELISMTTPPDFIQIISWNDYGESHYVGPKLGTPPTNTNWVEGFDHQSWLKMSEYSIKWYKTGVKPTIEEDVVYFNYRPHSVNAVATSDNLPPPSNASVSTDAVYASTFLTSSSNAAQLRIMIEDMQQSFTNLNKSDISTFTAPWNGHTGSVEVSLLTDNGEEIMKTHGSIPISDKIKTYNFNYAAAMMSKGSTSSASASKFNAAKPTKSHPYCIFSLYLQLLSV